MTPGFDPFYEGSSTWRRYVYCTPFCLAYEANGPITYYVDGTQEVNVVVRPRVACEDWMDENLDPWTFEDEDNPDKKDFYPGFGSFDKEERKRFLKLMMTELDRAGCLTDDGMQDWVPGIYEEGQRVKCWMTEDDPDRTDTIDPSPTIDSAPSEPVTFETKVQKRGHSTAIYIPKAMEREAGISPGDIVEISIKPVSH